MTSENTPDTGLDDLLNRHFPGKVVRKDLTKLVTEGANVPVYVLEYLLGSYCASVRYPLGGPFVVRVDWARRFSIDEKRNLFPDEESDSHWSFFIGYNY